MQYLWTEDRGAGFHFWNLMNSIMYEGILTVESKMNNQQLLDDVRNLRPRKGDVYYIAFDMVYDNMDVMNKTLELHQISKSYPEQMIILDMICFEYFILVFEHLIDWTGTGRKDKIAIREQILNVLHDHKIDIDRISDQKTINYLKGFKKYSTERVLKSITYELTDGDLWSVKGEFLGDCWYKDCCVLKKPNKHQCNLEGMSGKEKIVTLLEDKAVKAVRSAIRS